MISKISKKLRENTRNFGIFERILITDYIGGSTDMIGRLIGQFFYRLIGRLIGIGRTLGSDNAVLFFDVR